MFMLIICKIFLYLLSYTYAQPNFISHVCQDTFGNYSANSAFQKNLNTFFSTISSDTTIDYGFYNISVGTSLDTVNGIGLCRPDLSPAACRSCLDEGARAIVLDCPNQKDAIGWYEKCMIRYTDRYIFGRKEFGPWYPLSSPVVGGPIDKGRYNQTATALLAKLQAKAAAGDSHRKFAAGEANVTSSFTVYALVQCTPDLEYFDCYDCLDNAINYALTTYYGEQARIFFTSCNIRYENYRFYNSTSLSLLNSSTSLTPPSSASSPPSITRTKKATSPNALYIGYNCTGSTSNSANDSNKASPLYLYNLYNLLGTFTTQASDTAYYNSSLGETPNRVYAFYICRFDQNAKSCTACINGAKDRILKACPYQTEAIIWYENCMMRYSRFSFFGKMDVSPWIPIMKPQNISKAQVAHFADSMRKSMTELATLTAGNSSSKNKFQVRAVNLSGFGSLYETAQCVPEITAKDCHLCLTTAVARLSISVSARALLPSCIVWYQTTPFYNSSQITYPLFNSSSTIDPPSTSSRTHGKPRKTKLVFATIFVSIPIASLLAFGIRIYIRKKKATETTSLPLEEIKTMESLHFDLSTIRAATRNFCLDNKLGEGGFGAVYKGILDDGQEIALKRLGKQSKQGIVEFKTEVLLLAKLQHKNLVRLLGFCVASDEKILIYEYLKNSSLDRFLFDPSSNQILDWATRYNIIFGIARGLLYLHEDSRLKIIHRDLKSSNILLDKVMNPKISDFGLAKLFVGDETQGDTKRIVGTYGYMAPEYAMTGHFSVKSDVYSFGVIVLEIVTGQKNIIFGRAQVEEALLHRAWRLWNEGTPLDLVDTTLGNDYPEEEVKKCIHIGLLCIQDIALERPRMASIVAALNGQSISLPMPKAPHFFGDPTIAELPPVLYNQLMEGTAIEYHQHQALDQEGCPSVFSGTENITQLYPR